MERHQVKSINTSLS